ncbi:MAG: hypothetical protein ACJAYU_004726 [Bradymonadia bacterium]|jgi:hypothetical protein
MGFIAKGLLHRRAADDSEETAIFDDRQSEELVLIEHVFQLGERGRRRHAKRFADHKRARADIRQRQQETAKREDADQPPLAIEHVHVLNFVPLIRRSVGTYAADDRVDRVSGVHCQ